ncbi:MAG TPA: group III truncated hemoglobin [Chitinophagaceae bacterium]|jgi:hemoglobin|nr:group III truncated hemoglobin [Chitinophagaceae bacterium]
MSEGRRDISGREDIVQLLEAFYGRVLRDEVIGHFFTEVVPLDLEAHLPHIADFWESVLFLKPGYDKNVMAVHQQIHHLSPIRPEHLDRWVTLFRETVDAHFAGPKAELARQRAQSVATLMSIKLGR